MKPIKILIPYRMKGIRIDAALSEMLPNYSRSKISALIKSKNILLNKKPFKPKDKINGNEIIWKTILGKLTKTYIKFT